MEPARLAARSAAVSPAWSTTPPRDRSIGATSAPGSNRAARRTTASSGSWPRARTAPGRLGTGTRSTGGRAAAAAAAASSPASGPASPAT
ncbi:hypothetical protein [Nocardioides euryhalodurans]|uniref:hypothetical protein n=1 Tax=Nocardioides euryhalodurans TaxID=2518370 RepID=UPI0014238489|nr:hypothetical protein [Nocardioides euryhalodurans]